MTLRFGLCLRFDKPLSEQIVAASRICYRPLLSLLLRQSKTKVNLILSGTFLDAIAWFDPELIGWIREGVACGRFRLLGTTYAQNLMPATDEWDNRRQILLHRQTVYELFGVEPTSFWCPGSAWDPALAGLLAGHGVQSTPLEARVLREAGAGWPAVYQLDTSAGTLNLLWEDAALRIRFAAAAWFHEPEYFLTALRGTAGGTMKEHAFPVICKDADAFGVWGYQQGLDPRSDLDGLAELLRQLESASGVESCFLEEAPAPFAALDNPPPGWSARLDRALTDSQTPEHEAGYLNWGDFQCRAPKLKHFRRIYTAVRTRLSGLEQKVQGAMTGPAGAYYEMAVRAFCAHQYRFGDVGIGGRGYPAWEGVGTAMTLSAAAASALDPNSAERPVIDDVTGDGEDEILLRQGPYLAVLTPFDGRVLFWGDLTGGQIFIGNPFAVPVGTQQMDSLAPELAHLADDWMPEDSPPAEPVEDDRGPERLRLLLEDAVQEAPGRLPVWPRPVHPKPRLALPARRRAFNDYVCIDGEPEEKTGHHMDFRLEDNGATFLRFFHYKVELIKRIKLMPAGIRVTYRFRNVVDTKVRISLRVISELCPGAQSIGRPPGRVLEPVRADARKHPGVLNTHTGDALILHSSQPTVEPVSFHPAVLAWEIHQAFAFTLEPGRTQMLILRLNLYPPEKTAQGVLLPFH